MKKIKDRRGSNIHNIQPFVDMCVRDVRSNNEIILRMKDTPLDKASVMFDEVRDKYGKPKPTMTLWDEWEGQLIDELDSAKRQIMRVGLIGSIKEDLKIGDVNERKKSKKR